MGEQNLAPLGAVHGAQAQETTRYHINAPAPFFFIILKRRAHAAAHGAGTGPNQLESEQLLGPRLSRPSILDLIKGVGARVSGGHDVRH